MGGSHLYCLFSRSLIPSDIYSSISIFDCPSLGWLSNQVFFSHGDAFFQCLLVTPRTCVEGVFMAFCEFWQSIPEPARLPLRQLSVPESHKTFPADQFSNNRKTPCICRDCRRALDPLFDRVLELFVPVWIAHGKEINRGFLGVCEAMMAEFIWTGPGASWRRQKLPKISVSLFLSLFFALKVI